MKQPHFTSLDALFHPTSIAVIGASGNPSKIGGRTFRFLKNNGFKGAVYPIHVSAAEVQGHQAWRNVRDVPSAVDLAFVIVPAHHVEAAIEDCVAVGVKAAVIFSSGFAEMGPEGVKAQQKLYEIAKAGNMRLVGPNCMGVMNPSIGMLGTFTGALDAYTPLAGSIGLASQSGAFGAHCFLLMLLRGMGLSAWVTTGNSADIDTAQCIAHFAQDEQTRVIVAYLEGIRDGAMLEYALQLAQQNHKPVVMLKVGSSELGALAAASHTASLVGENAVYDALFDKYQVHRTHSIDSLLDVTQAFAEAPLPASNRMAVVTVSGGVGAMMADSADALGLVLPELPQADQEHLKAMLDFAAVRNPIDITAQGVSNQQLIEENLRVALSCDAFDSVVLFLATLGSNQAMLERITPTLLSLRAQYPQKLVVLSTALPDRSAVEPLRKGGFLIYEDPTRAMECVAALVNYAERKRQPVMPNVSPQLVASSPPAVTTSLSKAYNEWQALEVIDQIGIATLPRQLVQSAAEAREAWQAVGPRVAMKIVSAEIVHKSDIGGVLLNIESAAAAEATFHTLQQNVKKAKPDVVLDGIMVVTMAEMAEVAKKGTDGAEKGIETLLGLRTDPLFGTVLAFGMGGIWVELFGETEVALAPIDTPQALRMIASSRASKLLAGFRGSPAANIDALADALVKLSHYASANAQWLDGLEINPLLVTPQGVLALDAWLSHKQR